jgi:hypothetical protein
VFHPEKGRPAQGKIVNGEITQVTTLVAGDGATPGMNKVTITAMEKPDDMYNDKSLIPQKYGDLKKSELTWDLKPGKNEVKFDIE